MPKRNNQRKKPKPKRAARPKRGPRPVGQHPPGFRNSLVPVVCSITDPFCPEAAGAKWPDGTIYKTVPYQNRFTISGTTGATGSAVVWLSPGLYYNYATNSPAASTVTWPNAFSIGGATPTGWQYGRIVSAGCKVMPTVSMTNSSGYFVCNEITEYAAGGASSTIGAMSDVQIMTQPMNQGEFVWISRAGPQGHVFRAPGGNTEFGTSSGDRTALMIQLVGGPASTAAFTVEVIVNWEFTFSAQDAMNPIATNSPPTNPTLQRASEAVQNAVGSFVKGNQDKIGVVVEAAAKTALRRIGNAAANYFTGGGYAMLTNG